MFVEEGQGERGNGGISKEVLEAQTPPPPLVRHSGQIPKMTGSESSFKFPNLYSLSTEHCPSSLLSCNFNNHIKNASNWGLVTAGSTQCRPINLVDDFKEGKLNNLVSQ